MASYLCPSCKALHIQSSQGYITGCIHKSPDIEPVKLNKDHRAWIQYSRSRGYYIAIPAKDTDNESH